MAHGNGSETAQRRSALFYMRVDPQLKAAAQRAAKADRRSLASLIEMS
jgi:predicted HicB family RNase H-like nuclease